MMCRGRAGCFTGHFREKRTPAGIPQRQAPVSRYSSLGIFLPAGKKYEPGKTIMGSYFIPFLYLQQMKHNPLIYVLLPILILSCHAEPAKDLNHPAPIKGTWQLVSGTTITKGVSSVTDYTKDQRMIKIINDDHFAFLKHDLNPPKDSANNFEAGGGSYTLAGDVYTEHLDYFRDRNWEGKTFTFTVSVQNDTLTQKGTEKVEGAGIDREIIEKYVRVKK
jgi:hypothetical protein